MSKHYVCLECKNESKVAGNCQTDFCLKQGLPLEGCDCEGGTHERFTNNLSAEPEEQAPQKATIAIDVDSEETL